VLNTGQGGELERALRSRLAPEGPLRGAALLPIVVAGRLHALLELGRSDHPFRSSDAPELASFALRLGGRLERLSVTCAAPKSSLRK